MIKLKYLITSIIFILIVSRSGIAENEIWTYGEVTSNPPLARICHTALYDYHNDRMIVYGGGYYLQTLGDLWQLESDSMIWTRIFPQNDGPYLLRSQCAVFNPSDTSMVLFGGVEYPGGYISDELWVFNLNSFLWTEIEPSGLWPPPTRCNYATHWPAEHKMVMFGGRDQAERYNTTWILDLDDYTWEIVTYQNTPPSPREGSPILILQGTSIMMIYGGYCPGPEYIDELWTLNLISGEWTQHLPDFPHPIARGYCPLIYDKENNRVLLFSGFSAYSGPGLNDLWEIGLDSMQYARLFPTGTIPSPRGRFTTIIGGFAEHKATIFGGAHNYQYYYDDIYFLDWDSIVDIEDDRSLPDKSLLINCFPNPFNSQTIFEFTLIKSDFVSLTIYDLLGHKIKTIVSDERPAGGHTVTFNASNLTSGIYFYKFQAGDIVDNGKMMLLK
ncbi:MAG: T9SS type A sorting domain-containing protein [Candidatus Zixiibacteriota bacterium]|nr:MAG: T9SS type A sorting domain-containing protein [candidate division Zixibacteria bacterium]